MDIKCPHCGTEYEVADEDFGRFVKCEICGKGFVVGTFAAREVRDTTNASDGEFKEDKGFGRKIFEWNIAKSPKTAKMLASAPWTIQFSTVYLLVFGLMFAGCVLLTSKSPSFIPALVVFAITISVGFALVRFNFVRWLLVLWGAFNLILLIFGSGDFNWLWPFNVSFVAVAVLLSMNTSRQWYKNGPTVNASADFMSYYRMVGIAVVLAIMAGIVLYAGYNSARKKICSSRDESFTYDSYAPSSYSLPSSCSQSSPTSARDAVSGALENVRRRYNAKLSRYGLTESYFDETSGICDLMLLDVASWTKYQIVYYRSTGQIEWPRIMPKNVAEDLMEDRLLICTYETSLGTGKRKQGSSSSTASEPEDNSPADEDEEEFVPLHDEYVPTPKEQADIDHTLATARKLDAERKASKGKPPLAQISDLRRMADLKKRAGFTDNQLREHFGEDRFRQFKEAEANGELKKMMEGYTVGETNYGLE